MARGKVEMCWCVDAVGGLWLSEWRANLMVLATAKDWEFGMGNGKVWHWEWHWGLSPTSKGGERAGKLLAAECLAVVFLNMDKKGEKWRKRQPLKTALVAGCLASTGDKRAGIEMKEFGIVPVFHSLSKAEERWLSALPEV